MERHFKGLSNHYRLEILLLVDKNSGITVEQITEILKANFKTISGHTRKLVRAGLLNKKYAGSFVKHDLSPYGERMVKFIKEFQKVT